jgi:GAF domain-containing protein
LSRAVQSDGGTELVTPIAGPLADTGSPAVGAIALFHEQGDNRSYSAYERALVRNVALRLALFRTNSATREIATAISILRSRSPRQIETSPRITTPATKPSSWPKDIALAIERFDEPLSRLAASTDSHSVTLRIALPDGKATSPHGLALARVAAHPMGRLDEPFEIEREGDPGLHWDVMREGVEQYVPRIRGDAHFLRVRPGTMSTLCVPVRIEGILAGTLNLESPFVDNYAPFLPLVVALSGAVGRTLADSRAEIEGDLLDRTAQALTRRHEYSGVLTSMRADLEHVESDPLKEELSGKVETLQTLIQDLREPVAPTKYPAASLWEIVADSLRQLQLGATRERPTEELFHDKLVPRAAQAIGTVLTSVFRNVNYHSTPDGRDYDGQPVPRVLFRSTRIEGTDQAVIIVENLSKNILDASFCAELYRYPVAPHGEIRLGTYIAGLNARRAGARIHGTPLQEGRALRTTLIVPVERLNDTIGSS